MTDYSQVVGAPAQIIAARQAGQLVSGPSQVIAAREATTPVSEEMNFDSTGTTYIRITNAVQRPISNILDVSGLIYDDQGLVMTLKKLQWSTAMGGPWTDGTILGADPGYNFPAAAVPAGTPYNVPVDILGAPTGNLWFRIEMEYDSTSTDDIAGTFPFLAYAPVPTLPDFIVVPEESYTGDYRVYWGGGSLTDYYEVEEATREDFGDAVQVYSGTDLEIDIEGKADGTYYYRVRGVNQFNVGPWLEGDNPVAVVPPAAPSSVSVPTESSTGAFRVSWTPSDGAEWYELQEDRSNAFTNPTMLYHGPLLFFDVYGKTDGRYYYRVRAGRG